MSLALSLCQYVYRVCHGKRDAPNVRDVTTAEPCSILEFHVMSEGHLITRPLKQVSFYPNQNNKQLTCQVKCKCFICFFVFWFEDFTWDLWPEDVKAAPSTLGARNWHQKWNIFFGFTWKCLEMPLSHCWRSINTDTGNLSILEAKKTASRILFFRISVRGEAAGLAGLAQSKVKDGISKSVQLFDACSIS